MRTDRRELARHARQVGLGFALIAVCTPALAQTSPFLTGATALEANILAWLTPIAIILVMVLGAMAMANRISWGWCIGAILGIAGSSSTPRMLPELPWYALTLEAYELDGGLLPPCDLGRCAGVSESTHPRLREIIKTRGYFQSDDAATNLICLAVKNITADWSRSTREWGEAMSQFGIAYGDRFARTY